MGQGVAEKSSARIKMPHTVNSDIRRGTEEMSIGHKYLESELAVR